MNMTCGRRKRLTGLGKFVEEILQMRG